MDKWPERLSIRDTKIYDDLGGLGQRIFTTAGAAYEKHTYYSEEYVSAKQARIEALENDFAYHSELCTIQQARIGALEQQLKYAHKGIDIARGERDEKQARIQAALEVYAGMEGFIPETAAEGYCLRIIEQMNEALQESDDERV